MAGGSPAVGERDEDGAHPAAATSSTAPCVSDRVLVFERGGLPSELASGSPSGWTAPNLQGRDGESSHKSKSFDTHAANTYTHAPTAQTHDACPSAMAAYRSAPHWKPRAAIGSSRPYGIGAGRRADPEGHAPLGDGLTELVRVNNTSMHARTTNPGLVYFQAMGTISRPVSYQEDEERVICFCDLEVVLYSAAMPGLLGRYYITSTPHASNRGHSGRIGHDTRHSIVQYDTAQHSAQRQERMGTQPGQGA
ncbi:hypothetical protein B0T10DRAFT_547560 [Thelonectria olida]|uniref:Uncharacterized protein n=1 Tax=Thelonectria olida TaxID=1576542 RepID=A0A9P8W7C0_9HYPO|nr:hypothetical protein B0T10DRAFT_547560 [Thelonectria olida]